LTYDPNIERAIINTDLYASSEGKEGYWTPQAGNEAAYRSGTYEGANLNPSQQLWSEEPIYISDQGQMDAINGQLAKMGLAAPAYAAAISTNAAQTAANPAAGSLTPAAAYAQGISATSDPGSPYMDLYDTAEERTNALKREQVDALYKSIQANADRYGYQIGDVNTAADDSARQAYILSMQNRRALPEILAAQGQPLGGATETANLRLLTNYENDLNSINTARNQDVAEINRAIAALYDEGALQASNINAQYGQSLLDTYLDLGQADIAYRQAAEEAAKQERLASEQQERQAYLDTITRYSADYQAEINRLKALGYGDDYWKIQYLQAARQGKLNDIAAAEAAAAAELAEWERELQTIAYTKSLSGGSSSGSSLTAAQAMTALKSGVVTSEIIAAVDGAYGAGATEAVLKTLDTSNPYGLTEQEMAYAGADALSGSTYELEQEIDKLKSQIGQILQESDGKDKAKRLLAYYVDSGQISQTEANQILRDHGVSLSAIHISGR
jgi:hypothetical protein